MRISVLARDLGFTEGPTITREGDLVVTSIDQGRVYCVDGAGVSLLAETGGGPNGATSDSDDVIYVAQNGGNWMRNPHPEKREPGMSGGIQRIEAGRITWLSREPFAPNDICFGPDGLLYVTDPTRDGKYDDGRIWRCDPTTGETELVARVGWFCNGVAFGPDDRLYLASSGDRRVIRFDLTSAGDAAEEVVCQLDQHAPDGFAFDTQGNMIIGALARGDEPGEVQVWSAEGVLLERIRFGNGRHYTNTALSGDGRLVVCDSESGSILCVEDWPAVGLALYPLRHMSRRAPLLRSAIQDVAAR